MSNTTDRIVERIVSYLRSPAASGEAIAALKDIIDRELDEPSEPSITRIAEAALGPRLACPVCGCQVLPGFVCDGCGDYEAPLPKQDTPVTSRSQPAEDRGPLEER